MTTTTQGQLTLDNFRELTGYRFRVTNEQQARIYLTGLSDDARTALAGANPERVADIVGKRNHEGNPFRWMTLVGDFATNWTTDLQLTREQAFNEFVSSQGLERLEGRKPDVPLSVYQDQTLTLTNFSERVEAATGHKRRFRLPTDLAERVENKEITREQGFQETVQRILTSAQEQNTNE